MRNAVQNCIEELIRFLGYFPYFGKIYADLAFECRSYLGNKTVHE